MTAHILLVGDEPALPALLGAAGYRVTIAAEPGRAAARALDVEPDIVLLDCALADLDARALVHAIRQESDVPMILLSGHDKEEEKIAALDEGADDYVDTPCDDREILSRIRVAERRRGRPSTTPGTFRAGTLAIDFASRRVTVADRPVRLSPKEYALLRVLARHAGEVVGHRRLLVAGWGPAAADTQYLRVYIGLLRQKIEDDPSDPQIVLTEPGIGYRLTID